jgi:hypothetical protein
LGVRHFRRWVFRRPRPCVFPLLRTVGSRRHRHSLARAPRSRLELEVPNWAWRAPRPAFRRRASPERSAGTGRRCTRLVCPRTHHRGRRTLEVVWAWGSRAAPHRLLPRVRTTPWRLPTRAARERWLPATAVPRHRRRRGLTIAVTRLRAVATRGARITLRQRRRRLRAGPASTRAAAVAAPLVALAVAVAAAGEVLGLVVEPLSP